MKMLLCITVIVAAAATAVHAQPYPNRAVRMIVAFPAGGGTDIVARVVGAKLGEGLGQQVVIDNRAGAGGVIGTKAAATAAPDGYTIFMATLGNLSVNPLLYDKLPFDVARDFAPLTRVVAVTFMLWVYPAFPVKTVSDLIALAKSKPVNYASGGTGTGPHLAAELFNSMAGVKMTHIAYKGSAPSFTAVMGGETPLVFDSLAQGLPYLKSGKLRAVATLSARRTPALPEVPAVAETLSGYEFVNWFGLVAPAATPRDIINRLNAEVVKVLHMPEVRDKLIAMGAEPVGDTPAEFGAYLKSEAVKWAKVVKEANIHAN